MIARLPLVSEASAASAVVDGITAPFERELARLAAAARVTPAAPAKKKPVEPQRTLAVGGFVQASPRFVRG